MSFDPFNQNNARRGVTIQGLNENIRALETIVRQWNQAKIRILRTSSDYFVRQARSRVHKVSGTLDKSISVDNITAEIANISAKTHYATKEEERPGIKFGVNTPHAYMLPSARDTNLQLPKMIKKEIDDLLSRNKSL